MGRRNQNRPPRRPKIRVPKFPTLENCDLEDPEEMFLWGMVAMPKMKGAPLAFPDELGRLLSQRFHDLGFRYHPELRKLKYRKPRVGDPHFLTNPGRWVPIDEPDEDDEVSPEEVARRLSPEQKAAIRKRFGLDEDPPKPVMPDDGGKVPYTRRDGSVVMVSPADARRYANAKRIAEEHLAKQKAEREAAADEGGDS